ncbi:unnamed protein product [Nezara viridula]|uniref:Uncharacterized protein n=1 Tax=Nezara viridula TaxID=85310 RepID=A0A9P0HDM7_NEZVI|nr:unnamed protein product [Nezara viridula]
MPFPALLIHSTGVILLTGWKAEVLGDNEPREDQIKGGIPQGELITALSFSGPTSHTSHSRLPMPPQSHCLQHLNPNNDGFTFTIKTRLHKCFGATSKEIYYKKGPSFTIDSVVEAGLASLVGKKTMAELEDTGCRRYPFYPPMEGGIEQFKESSQAAKNGGCFTGNSTVEVAGRGKKKLSELKVGDKVASYDNGKIVYSEVIMFLDRNPESKRQFLNINTPSTNLRVTPQHLLIRVKDNNTLENVFAARIKLGDILLVSSEKGELHQETVIKSELVLDTGVYAPLTKTGTVIVDRVVASCYAVIESQTIAHFAFAPVRLYVNAKEAISRFYSLVTFRHSTVHAKETAVKGIPWYPFVLYKFSSYFAPKFLMYDTSDVNKV